MSTAMLANTLPATEPWITKADDSGHLVTLRVTRQRRGNETIATLADGHHVLVRGREVFQAVGDGMIYKCNERDAP